MRSQALEAVKRLMADPPEALVGIADRLDECEDISQLEGLHVALAREMGRALLEKRLAGADPPPGACPDCSGQDDEAPGAPDGAGLSPPEATSSRADERKR